VKRQSELDRREVSLADAVKKPIVPLLLEKMSWPPEGPMSMVFAQLLYIDFSQPDTDVQLNWNCAQFDQLIRQIDCYLDESKNVRITFSYWFLYLLIQAQLPPRTVRHIGLCTSLSALTSLCKRRFNTLPARNRQTDRTDRQIDRHADDCYYTMHI